METSVIIGLALAFVGLSDIVIGTMFLRRQETDSSDAARRLVIAAKPLMAFGAILIVIGLGCVFGVVPLDAWLGLQ
jgi:NADH:ubiquinone oxidoreductase subunit 2 (subunit N)